MMETDIASVSAMSTSVSSQDRVKPADEEPTFVADQSSSATVWVRMLFGVVKRELDNDASRVNNFVAFITVVAVLQFILETMPEIKNGLPDLTWMTLETVCVVVFSIEFVLKLTVAQSKWQFWTSPMNWVDLAAILPFYIDKLAGDQGNAFVVLRVVRLTRVMRIVKMGNFSGGVKVFTVAFQKSLPELAALMSFTWIAMVIFASLIFFAELPDGTFNHIPHAFWWCLVTMTTVGYGDYFPTTTQGHFIGVGCMLVGILIFALPITVMGENYAAATKDQNYKQLQQDMKQALVKGDGIVTLEALDSIFRQGGKWSPLHQLLSNSVERIFEIYDKNGNQELCAREVNGFLKDIKQSLSGDLLSNHTDIKHESQSPRSLMSELSPRNAKEASAISPPSSVVGLQSGILLQELHREHISNKQSQLQWEIGIEKKTDELAKQQQQIVSLLEGLAKKQPKPKRSSMSTRKHLKPTD